MEIYVRATFPGKLWNDSTTAGITLSGQDFALRGTEMRFVIFRFYLVKLERMFYAVWCLGMYQNCFLATFY